MSNTPQITGAITASTCASISRHNLLFKLPTCGTDLLGWTFFFPGIILLTILRECCV